MIDAGIALLAALFCRTSRPMLHLCLAYAAIRVAAVLLLPSPAVGAPWYYACAAGEFLVVIAALVIAAPASTLVALLSIIGLAVHISTAVEYSFMTSTLLYSNYPWLVSYMESLQLAGLFLFSPPSLAAIRAVLARFKTRKEPDQCNRTISTFG